MARRFSDLYSHEGDISKTEALAKCANFLGGSWSGLAEEDFTIKVLT